MSVSDVLQRERKALLDLSGRNRLINLPSRPSPRSIVVHDELSAEVHTLLVGQKRTLSFLAASTQVADAAALTDEESSVDFDATHLALPPPHADDSRDQRGVALRHTDTRLQTALKSEALQARLLKIFYEARTLLEEQGVNVLYLALGQLRYRESRDSDIDRFAPLVLIPVQLTRKDARDQFLLAWTGEDVTENLSLAEKARVEFGLVLPAFDPGDDDFSIIAYFDAIEHAIASQPDWAVLRDQIALGFFSFSKLLMFRDLDPENWPEGGRLEQHATIGGLLGGGFPARDSIPDNANIDALVSTEQLRHVVDCDSTQAIAIEEVRRGSNLVIQGPPGTGKSQTIMNLIASQVAEGKTVLFVSEKMAALEVVKRRLAALDLGPLCLELHSNKANKKSVLGELGAALDLTKPTAPVAQRVVPDLEQARDALNDHASKLHQPFGAACFTAFEVLGELARCRDLAGFQLLDRDMLLRWTRADIEHHERTLAALAARIQHMGAPDAHTWRGACLELMMLPDAESLLQDLHPARAAISLCAQTAAVLASTLGLPAPATMSGISHLVAIAERIRQAPKLDRTSLSAPQWNDGLDALEKTIDAGRTLTRLRATLEPIATRHAWTMDWNAHRKTIAGHGSNLLRFLNASYRAAVRDLRSVCTSAPPATLQERLQLLDDLLAAQRAAAQIAAGAPVAEKALGRVWKHLDTDWAHAASIVQWVASQRGACVGTEGILAIAARTPRDDAFTDALAATIAATDHANIVLLFAPGLSGGRPLNCAA